MIMKMLRDDRFGRMVMHGSEDTKAMADAVVKGEIQESWRGLIF